MRNVSLTFQTSKSIQKSSLKLTHKESFGEIYHSLFKNLRIFSRISSISNRIMIQIVQNKFSSGQFKYQKKIKVSRKCWESEGR